MAAGATVPEAEVSSTARWSGWSTHMRRPSAGGLALGLGWLRGIGAQKTILKGRPVKAANNRVHLLGVRRVNKREALGLLRFGIADNLNCVRDQVLGG